MADNLDQTNLRRLDIATMLKGFGLSEFVFKNELCEVIPTNGDSIRWYQETSTDISVTAPSIGNNLGRLTDFPYAEHSWTRNTSYPKKYGIRSKISLEDAKGADIDVLARMILRLTRYVAKAVDTDVWNVITESQSAVNINAVTSTAAWDAASGQNPIEDVLESLQKIEEAGYDSTSAVIVVSPAGKKALMTWLTTSIGDKILSFSTELARGAELTRLLGRRVITSVNVTADYAAVVVPGAAIFKEFVPLTSTTIDDPGVGTEIRVWQEGITLLTDPKKVSLISNTAA